MSVYVDASFVVALFAADSFSQRAEDFLTVEKPALLVSDFVSTEFAAVVARQVRMKTFGAETARQMFARFDTWATDIARRVQTTSADIATAGALIRRLDLNLRAPDAIILASVQALAASLATFDEGMTAAARRLSIPLAAV